MPVDAFIEVAGHSFELQNFVVPRLITGELPFVSSVGQAGPFQVTTPIERERAVTSTGTAVENELAGLQLIVGNTSARAFDCLAAVAAHLQQLVPLRRSLRTPSQTIQPEHVASVHHMKDLGATATAQLQQVPRKSWRPTGPSCGTWSTAPTYCSNN